MRIASHPVADLRHGAILALFGLVALAPGCAETTGSNQTDPSAESPSDPPLSNGAEGKGDYVTDSVAIRGPVEFGSSVDGEFADEPDYVGYVFEVDGPAEIDATVRSSDVDPEIWLYGPKDVDTGEWGDEIAENDDLEFGETEDAGLRGVQLEESGRYLVVTAPHYDEGDYRLSVDCAGAGCNQPTICRSSEDCTSGSCNKNGTAWDADRGYCKGTAGSGDDGGECGAGVQQVHTVPASQVDSFPSGAQSDNDSSEALEVEGDVAYTANRQKGVCAYDVSAPADARPIGCAPPPTLPDDSRLYRAEGIVVDGDRLYVRNTLFGVWIYDFSDPQNPEKLGHYGVDQFEGDYLNAVSMTVHGDYIYLPSEKDGIHILDASDPTDPRHAGHLADNGIPENARDRTRRGPINIDIDDGYLYAAMRLAGVGVYDLDDPTDPRKVAQLSIDHDDEDRIVSTPWGSVRDSVAMHAIEVRDGLAYLAVHNHPANLHVLDVSDPEDPELAWQDSVAPNQRRGVTRTIDVSENYVTIARPSTYGTLVFDRSTPTSPQFLGTAAVDGGPADLHIDEERGFVFFAASSRYDDRLRGLGVIEIGCE